MWLRNFDDGEVGGMVIANTFTMADLLSDPTIGMLLQMLGITDLSLGWQVTAACGSYSPTFSLYYGMAPLTMPEDNQCSSGLAPLADLLGTVVAQLPNPTNSGTATTPLIALPPYQQHYLRFWLKASIHTLSDVDEFRIEVLEGNTPTTVWKKADLADADYNTWKQISVDLKGWEGHSIKIRFTFDALGGTGDGGTGINIDDISIAANCNPL